MSVDHQATISERLLELARGEPERPLLSTFSDGEWTTLTAAELYNRVGATAAAVAAIAPAPPTRVLIALPNGEALVCAVLACWWLGVTPLIASPDSTDCEMETLLAGVPGGSDGVIRLTESVSPAPVDPLPASGPEPAIGWCIPSGGTTGLPQFVPVSLTPTMMCNIMWEVMSRCNWQSNAVQLSVGPLFHAGPFTSAFAGLAAGAHVVVSPRFIPSILTSATRRFEPTWSLFTPHQMALLEANESLMQLLASSLDGVMHTSAPCPVDLKRRWIDRLGADRIFEVYGATQMVGGAMCSGREWLARPGTVGKPLTEVKIIGPDQQELPAGVVGEIYLRPSVQSQKLDDTVAHVRGTPDGYFSVGDLGYLDEDGFLYLTDRVDDVFLVGGVNVGAREIENVLRSCPEVSDAVVGPRKHELWGNTVYAAIVPSNAASPPTSATLQAYCRERLAAYKVPVEFEFVDELFRSRAGKVERFRYPG